MTQQVILPDWDARTAGRGDSVTLKTFTGIGDALVALPIGYALCEAGARVAIEGIINPDAQTSGARSLDLPHLPMLDGREPYSAVSDLRTSLVWNSEQTLLDRNLARMGMAWGTTPRTACLLTPERTLEHDYVVVCAQGLSSADHKRLIPEQVAAATGLGKHMGFRTVAVGAEAGQSLPVDLDLRGQTTLPELCGLVAHALAVVTTDTGILHLAGAYQTPLVAVIPAETLSVAAMQDYLPRMVLIGVRSADVSPRRVMDALRSMVDAARTPWCVVGPNRNPCGVAGTGRVMAAAAHVSYRTYEEHDGGACVCEYHFTDANDAHRVCDPNRTVLSLHTPQLVDPGAWGGTIFRSRGAQREHGALARRSLYLPLHSPFLAPASARRKPGPLRLVWHGMAHRDKGLREILAAWRQCAGVELRILGSSPTWWGDGDWRETLAGESGPGLTVDIRPEWGQADLDAEFLQADAFVAFDTVDKEQSAAITTVLGYGKPVAISTSTAFADVRPWCVTATAETLADELMRLATDPAAYAEAGHRAWLGAQYRRPELLSRHYRAAVVQALIDAG
jgi:hypothetical protein